MSNQDMGGPAFPPNAGWRDNDPDCHGATLWDYFAAAALQGAVSRGSADCDEWLATRAGRLALATRAGRLADAMLAERAKRQEGGDGE